MSAADHLRDAIAEGCTRDDHDHIADHRTEVIAERDAEIIAWLGKKAREYRSTRSKQHALQANAVDVMASKLARGAVRPDNLRMLPADFFEPGHSYTHRDGSDFLCVSVDPHPVTGERLAMGWRIEHGVHFLAVVGINQWNHEYDGVEPPAEAPHPAPCRYPTAPNCTCGGAR